MKFLTPLVTQKHSAEPGEFILYRDFKVLFNWKLLNELFIVTVPRGFITDFASVPRLAQLLPGFNRTESSANAAVLHDWSYCCRGEMVVDTVSGNGMVLHLSRKECDQLLYEGLIASGYSRVVAWLFYSAVRVGGWIYWNRRKDGLDMTNDFVPADFDWGAP